MTKAMVDLGELSAYDYQLPRELIAQYPVEQRIDARLMLIDRRSGEISHHHVRDLPELLTSGDALVLNNSKVIPARLVGFRTSTRGKWEGLYLRKSDEGIWELLSKTRGRLATGETISLRDRDGRESEQLVVCAQLENGHLAMRPIEPAEPLDFLDRFGRVPLPPYIRDGQMIDHDTVAYQTVYAKEPGSVAAPTAGLHFTPALLKRIQARGVSTVAVTLHVGLGTFRPINTDNLANHIMHSEIAQLTQAAATKLNSARADAGRIVAVGTTSTRVLEAVYNRAKGCFEAWSGETDLFIRPPYEFAAVDALLTNFHLPKSTLLVLVSTFAGLELVQRAYREAIAQKYRFYSYGDCMLIV